MIFKFARSVTMIVCVCAGVSERKLRAVIAGGATTVNAVGRECGAGTGCGACRPLIRGCIRRCQAESALAAPAAPDFTLADAAELAPA
jgi:bacterioferritin-associated ferredoxin